MLSVGFQGLLAIFRISDDYSYIVLDTAVLRRQKSSKLTSDIRKLEESTVESRFFILEVLTLF